jgi:hypothetical protein
VTSKDVSVGAPSYPAIGDESAATQLLFTLRRSMSSMAIRSTSRRSSSSSGFAKRTPYTSVSEVKQVAIQAPAPPQQPPPVEPTAPNRPPRIRGRLFGCCEMLHGSRPGMRRGRACRWAHIQRAFQSRRWATGGYETKVCNALRLSTL